MRLVLNGQGLGSKNYKINSPDSERSWYVMLKAYFFFSLRLVLNGQGLGSKNYKINSPDSERSWYVMLKAYKKKNRCASVACDCMHG